MSTQPTRSGFVTGVGVSFLILGVASFVLAGIQFLLVLVFVDQEALRAGMQAQHNVENFPEAVRWVLANLTAFSAAYLGTSLLLTVTCIGLLRRRNWARWLFVGFMLAGIALHLAPLVAFRDLFGWSAGMLEGSPDSVRDRANAMVYGAWLAYAAFALVFSALFAWIAWKLLTPGIAREFRGTRPGQ